MIVAKAAVLRPGDVVVRVTLDMKLEDLHLLCEQLSDKWPSWQLSSVLGQIERKFTATYEAEQEFSS